MQKCIYKKCICKKIYTLKYYATILCKNIVQTKKNIINGDR